MGGARPPNFGCNNSYASGRIVFDPSNNGRLYMTCAVGLFYTTPATYVRQTTPAIDWTQQNKNQQGLMVNDIVRVPVMNRLMNNMVALPCDPKLSSDLLDWKMSVRVASSPYFVDFVHSIGDSRRGLEIQKHWQGSRYESDCLFCSGVGAVCEFESQQDVVTIVHTCERGVTQRDDRAKRRGSQPARCRLQSRKIRAL